MVSLSLKNELYELPICPSVPLTPLKSQESSSVTIISILQLGFKHLFSSGFHLYVLTQKNSSNTWCSLAVPDWNFSMTRYKGSSIIVNLTAEVLEKSEPSMQSWDRPCATMTGQKQSRFPARNRNLTFVSPRTLNSFPFAVVRVPVTGLTFETCPLFFHVSSFNTLTVASVSSNIQVTL